MPNLRLRRNFVRTNVERLGITYLVSRKMLRALESFQKRAHHAKEMVQIRFGSLQLGEMNRCDYQVYSSGRYSPSSLKTSPHHAASSRHLGRYRQRIYPCSHKKAQDQAPPRIEEQKPICLSNSDYAARKHKALEA